MEVLAFIVLACILFVQHRRLSALERDVDQAAVLITELSKRLVAIEAQPPTQQSR